MDGSVDGYEPGYTELDDISMISTNTGCSQPRSSIHERRYKNATDNSARQSVKILKAITLFLLILVIVDTAIIGFLLWKALSSQVQTQQAGERESYQREVATTYVRWGRTVCPREDVELVYSGITGGSHYSHNGSGANYLCLHQHPQWAKYKDGIDYWRAYIYGAEYEDFPGIDMNLMNNKDMPCAVCRVPEKSTMLMIPARLECPDTSWTHEYIGYLMAAPHAHPTLSTGRSMFECMDADPEALPGGEANQNGALLYAVEARCGSLPCLRYINGRELTCVVCSK